ncbi:MAG: ABC transporter ATP-binding protein [Bacteroidetes bacterium]|nr:ABC transporter ATP-binding protein [Bacteroidota bacterium]
MLAARNLTKTYGTLKVLDNVSLSVAAGEMLSIIGPSGAGKSTLLHLLGALDKPDSGQVRLGDLDVFSLSPARQAKFRNEQIGFVFQAHHLLPEFNAVENVAMPLWIAGKQKNAAIQTASVMLEKVGLAGRIHHKPSELSGGEQQRVAIARALVNQPKILMADEPTGNLDTANALAIHRLFLNLQQELKQTIVLITHNESLAAQTDRTLVMRDGAVVEERKHNTGKADDTNSGGSIAP